MSMMTWPIIPGPSDESPQHACAKYDRHHSRHRPTFGEMYRRKKERGNQNSNTRATALFDWALHVTAKAGLFADSRRDCRDHHCQPFEREGGDKGKIITLPERYHRIGDKPKQQNNRCVYGRSEEDRSDHGPKPF